MKDFPTDAHGNVLYLGDRVRWIGTVYTIERFDGEWVHFERYGWTNSYARLSEVQFVSRPPTVAS